MKSGMDVNCNSNKINYYAMILTHFTDLLYNAKIDSQTSKASLQLFF